MAAMSERRFIVYVAAVFGGLSIFAGLLSPPIWPVGLIAPVFTLLIVLVARKQQSADEARALYCAGHRQPHEDIQ